jgi:excinuclease ABC subunit C
LKGLFSRLAFTGFGPHALMAFSEPPPLTVINGRRAGRLRDKVRAHGPRRPGVYGMVDAAGELIYVGKAKCLRTRLLSYFRPNSRDPKAGRILERTRTIVWEPGPNEFSALLRELELIRRWQPRCNVQGQPARYRRTYLCLGRQPAPHVFLAARPPATAKYVFGPLPAGARATEAARRLNDWFSLRDCPQAQEMIFADQRELFPVVLAPGCLRHDIGQCLAPCAAVCSRDEYRTQVRAALAFLDGHDPNLLPDLERNMTAAGAALAYERAAALRDKLAVLQWLDTLLQRMRDASNQSFVYAPAGHNGQQLWYLIDQGSVKAVTAGPTDDALRAKAATALTALYGKRHARTVPPTVNEIDEILLVSAWFRRHGAQKERTLTPEQALSLVREQ